MVEGQEGSLMTETAPETAWHSEEYNEIVERKGWKSPDDAVKSYRESEKMSSGQVKIPGEESSPEERSAFYNKIGRPDAPEGYEIADIPDNVGMTDEMLSDIKKDAFDLGGPKVLVETVIKNHLNRLSEQLTEDDSKRVDAVKEEWKGDYDTNHEIAERYVAEHCSDEIKQFLLDAKLDNHPVFVKHFFEQGKKTLSDTLIKGSQNSGEKEAEYKPAYPNDPSMYRTGDDDDSKRAREYFVAKGHVY